jgi:hypothetical protein
LIAAHLGARVMTDASAGLEAVEIATQKALAEVADVDGSLKSQPTS